MGDSEDYFNAKDGTKLHYRFWKPKKVEETLLCIHGAGAHSEEFRFLGEYLSSFSTQVYGIDMRGHGLSEGERGDIKNIRTHLEDINEVVHLIKSKYMSERLFLLGHSLGGTYSLWYSSEFPETLDGLILAAPEIGYLHKPNPYQILKLFSCAFNPKKKWNAADTWSEELRQSESMKYFLADERCVKEFSFRYVMALAKISGRNALRFASKIKIPFLILQGDKDELVDPKGTQELYDKVASSDKEIMILEGSDHSLYGGFSFTTISKYSEAHRKKVFDCIYQWLEKRKK